MKKYSIGIVGATGAVGQEIIRLLEKREFPVAQAKLLASSRSSGRQMQACGNLETVEETTVDSFEGLDLAIFSAGSENTLQFAEAARDQGCVVIDNSSAFRMQPDIPLVVPEINADELEKHRGIIANPNCSTAVALMGLYPLHQRFGLLRFFAATYQAVSGAGTSGSVTLNHEIEEILSGERNEQKPQSPFNHPIAFNLIPHIDSFREDGYTKEEMKMRNESRKILGTTDLQVSCTCVRVPVHRAHSICINAEFKSPVNVPDAKTAIEGFDGIELWDLPNANRYPMPLAYSEKENCGIGRLRLDHGFKNGLCFWVVGDQLWKGAALNAVQIAEQLIERQCLRFL
ncbi:MAG: aspartate-semialdehyde dehydrogenase [Verrucomicrobiota bacterium]|nr:aspartate-semialdehyde dehydrogenase [Verrucomicrobiota bacterium]